MSRASQPRVFGSDEWGGGLKLWRVSLWDRCCPFAGNKPKLNTKSPTRGVGGESNVCNIRPRVPAGLSFTDFFSGAVVFANSNAIKTIKSSTISGVLRMLWLGSGYLFSAVPGGRQKVQTFSSADRWTRNTNFFGNFRKRFFWAMQLRLRKKTPRNSGGGGVAR
jgi:hypothetical protein